MVVDTACCVWCASAQAWICTSFVDACPIARTFRVLRTFWTTIWRTTNIVTHARAYGGFFADNSTNGVRTAWWRCTWIDRDWWYNGFCSSGITRRLGKVDNSLTTETLTLFLNTSYKRISNEVWFTAADRIMSYNLAPSILSACSGTRVDAFGIVASKILSAVRAYDTLWATIRWSSNVADSTTTNCVLVKGATRTVGTTRWWWAYIRRRLIPS